MRRRYLVMVFLPATLVLALAGALAWLQHTEAGARWAWSRASGFVPGELRAGDIRGDLRSGLTFNGLSFENETLSVAAGSAQLRFDFDLFPTAVVVQSLVLDRIVITELAGSGAAPERPIEDLLSAFALPIPLDFPSIRIGQLVYQRSDGTKTFESGALSFSGLWHKDLIVREAKLSTVGGEWKARGELEFKPPFPLSATVDGRFELSAGATSPPSEIRVQATLGGDLTDMAVQAEFGQPAASVQGRVVNLLREPGWELELSSDELQWPLDSDSPQVILRQVAAHGSGDLNDYQLEAGAALGVKGLPVLSAELRGTGDISGLQIDRLHLLGEPGELTAGGLVSWAEDFRIELNSAIDRLSPGQWLQGWPADHPLHGGLEADWQRDHVVVRNIDLAADASEFSMHGDGVWDTAADRVTADLEWQALRWPVGADQADFSSEHGKVQVQGKPTDWSVTGSMQLQGGQWPNGLVTINGTGDLESVQLEIERGQVLGGSFNGQFDYRWAGRQSWSARVRAQNLDISSLNKSLPGSVSGAFTARGQTGPTEIVIDISQMDGTVRGQPVSARGGVSLTSEGLRARDLLIESGESRLELDGDLESAEGVRFSGHVDALGKFVEGARGAFDANGRMSTSPTHPLLEMELQGSDLAWDGLRIGKITTRQAKDLDDATATRFELADVSFGNELIDEIKLTISGQDPLDNIQMEARMGATRLEASLAGAVSHWSALPDTQWKGEIRSMSIHNETLGFLNLEQAAELVVDPGSLDLGPACFNGSRKGRICLDQRWSAGEGVTVRASLEAISFNLVQLFLGTELDFSQTLTGEVQWQQAVGKKPYAEVRVELSPGQIAFADDESILSSGPGLLEFRIIDGQLLSGNLKFDLPGAGSINTDFGAPDISMGVDSIIDGRIQIQLDRIEPLLNWIPQLDSVAGTINADMRLSGTLAEPRLTGHALLVRGKIEHSAIGLSLTDITLAGAVYNFNHTEFNGSFTSGEGRGRLKALVKFDDIFKPEITLEITGQNLNLINVPDMTVKADPDLRLHWYDSLLNLDGSILIPVARISPRYLPSTSASESQDLVVTSGELPPGKESFFDRSKLRLNGSVVVELGKNVTVTLERATARLRGKATFKWDNNLLPVADGSYKLSGELYAYGQLLEVSEGRVSFPHVPADNPHLNVNAEREIYGNVQVKQAGVHITGTLERPVLEPYTKPVTTRERALTLLVTGHDFDYEQGVGGVEVGMYIAPRLYVSYGLGLFETQSVISARYDLKNGFGIKATSGQRETGADISYTIER